METSWEKYSNELIREIAGEIEKDRRSPQRPARSEHPIPNPSDLSLPAKPVQ